MFFKKTKFHKWRDSVADFQITLFIVSVTHQLLGWFFAWQISLAPSPHGYTGVSVAVGTLIVAIGEMFGIFIIFHFNLLIMPWLLLVPLGFLLNAGVPMFVFQIAKKIIEDRRNSKLTSGDGLNEPSLER